MQPSRIRLLGRFAVESGGEPVPEADLGNRKARLLLKLLAVRHDRHVPMDAIVDALWLDEPPAKAVENVATLVSRLRTTLGSAVIDGGRSGYRLVVPAGCTVDTDDARRLVEEAEGRLAAGQPALASTAAAQALDVLGAGAPLEEEAAAGEWLDELRRALDRLIRRARVAGWRASAGIGEHRHALALAEQAVASDPLDEEAHRAVIAAYHRLGEPGEALAAYERVRCVLVEELGTDPGPETQALHLAVLRGEAVPDDAGADRAGGVRLELVGREDELAALVQRWDAVSRGDPSCVLVVGEAGIGTSTLVRALAHEVRATGGTAVEARCYASEESLFLQPIVEAVRELVVSLPPDLVAEAAGTRAGALAAIVPEVTAVVGPVVHEPTSPELERRRTFEAVASFLVAISKRRPLLVMFDDLHHAAASTLELLRFVLRWDRSARLLLAATVHRDRMTAVEAHLGERSTTLPVGPLSDEAVARLAADAGRAHLADELVRLTRGHTLFVLEALRAVSEVDDAVVIPDSLRTAVLMRVAQCGPDVEEFVRGAVVAGAVFDVEHVAELLGLSGEEAVRRAETALRVGLLAEAGTGYEFANDVIRRVLYDTTPKPTRVVRHRRLAVLLGHRPEAAAEHAAAAGDWELAVDQWLEAGSRLLAVFANREAEGLMMRASDACTLLVDPTRTARVQLLRSRARLAQSHYDDAAQDLASVQALARATGDSVLEAAALEQLAWCAYYARQVDRAGALAERALDHPDAGVGAQVLAGRLRNARGDLQGAIESLQPAAESADPIVRATALSYLGTALAHSDRFVDAVGVLEDAVGSCRVSGLLRPMFNAVMFTAITRANLGDLDGALHATAQLAADVERYESAAYLPRVRNIESWLWRELGDPTRALDLAHEALEASRLPDGYVEAEPAAHARLQLAECHLLLGDRDEAAGWLPALADAEISGVAFEWRVELQSLELRSRLDPSVSDELLAAATRYGSEKYRALALAHLGRRDEAATVAASTGSELLVASVAPEPMATEWVERVASRLRAEHRVGFVERGRWRAVTS